MYTYLRQVFTILAGEGKKVPGLLLLFLCVSVFDLAGLGLIGPYIALVTEQGNNLSADLLAELSHFGISVRESDLFVWLGIALILVFVFKAIAGLLVNHFIIRFAQRQQVLLRSHLMRSYQTLPYCEFTQRNSSEFIYNSQTLVPQFTNSVLQPGLRSASDAIIMLVILSFLIVQSGVVVLFFLTILGGSVFLFDRFFRARVAEYGRRANMAGDLLIKGINEGIGGLKEIRVLGQEEYFRQKVIRGSTEHIRFNSKTQFVSIMPRYFLELAIVTFAIALVFYSLSTGLDQGELLATVAIFAVAALRLLPAANTLTTSLIQLRFGKDVIRRLTADLDYLSRMGEAQSGGASSTSNTTKSPVGFKNLELRQIRYSYPGTKDPVLVDIGLTLQRGEAVGIMGDSGSGKTTLLDLLLGLLEADHGRLFFNGSDLKGDFQKLRQITAYLPQEAFLIDDTVMRNIALGVDDDNVDRSLLEESISRARLTETIASLKSGVETEIGESGARLSGGQRQRIALARAFYHQRQIFIMDESTSALDAGTEDQIVSEMMRLKGEKTTLMVTHRPSTIAHCDRVYVLKEGRVEKVGSPEDIFKGKETAAN